MNTIRDTSVGLATNTFAKNLGSRFKETKLPGTFLGGPYISAKKYNKKKVICKTNINLTYPTRFWENDL